MASDVRTCVRAASRIHGGAIAPAAPTAAIPMKSRRLWRSDMAPSMRVQVKVRGERRWRRPSSRAMIDDRPWLSPRVEAPLRSRLEQQSYSGIASLSRASAFCRSRVPIADPGKCPMRTTTSLRDGTTHVS